MWLFGNSGPQTALQSLSTASDVIAETGTFLVPENENIFWKKESPVKRKKWQIVFEFGATSYIRTYQIRTFQIRTFQIRTFQNRTFLRMSHCQGKTKYWKSKSNILVHPTFSGNKFLRTLLFNFLFKINRFDFTGNERNLSRKTRQFYLGVDQITPYTTQINFTNTVGCLRWCTTRGLSTGWLLLGPAKVKARKSCLFTEGSPEVEIKNTCLI